MVIDLVNKNSILSPYKPSRRFVWELDYMEAIPPDFMRTVIFLCTEEQDTGGVKRIPKATGFFTYYPVKDSQSHHINYVVTARHCIEEARQYGNLFIRVNLKAGGFVEFPTNLDDWFQHDSADVAAFPFLFSDKDTSGVKLRDLDIATIDPKSYVGGAPDYKIEVELYGTKKEIQPREGHQVYFLGLFTEHFSEERNLPIARFGNISRMPNYLTMDSCGTKSQMIAYLIEFHSWGGHSGSPVFYMYPTTAQGYRTLKLSDGSEIDVTVDVNMTWTTGLMGLISGHYPLAEEATTEGDVLGRIQVELNSGIAVVTPSVAITELLQREDLVAHREELRKLAE